jgi:hypothetical protein
MAWSLTFAHSLRKNSSDLVRRVSERAKASQATQPGNSELYNTTPDCDETTGIRNVSEERDR